MRLGVRVRWMWDKDIDTDFWSSHGCLVGVVCTQAMDMPEQPFTNPLTFRSHVQVFVGFGLFYVRLAVSWPGRDTGFWRWPGTADDPEEIL